MHREHFWVTTERRGHTKDKIECVHGHKSKHEQEDKHLKMQLDLLTLATIVAILAFAQITSEPENMGF